MTENELLAAAMAEAQYLAKESYMSAADLMTRLVRLVEKHRPKPCNCDKCLGVGEYAPLEDPDDLRP
jgi:hypothetical protein